MFCYYAKGEAYHKLEFDYAHFQTLDTIERNILDLAARQGLSLYTKENSAGNLTNVALASTTKGKSGQKGDFISRYAGQHLPNGQDVDFSLTSAEDMLAILFPHLFEDLEFMVSPEDDVMMDEAVVEDVADGVSQMHVNAEAGPSRVR